MRLWRRGRRRTHGEAISSHHKLHTGPRQLQVCTEDYLFLATSHRDEVSWGGTYAISKTEHPHLISASQLIRNPNELGHNNATHVSLESPAE